MVGTIAYATICLSLEEVTVLAGNEVLMKVDNIISLIVPDPIGFYISNSGLT
jgi:hypothetical protein